MRLAAGVLAVLFAAACSGTTHPVAAPRASPTVVVPRLAAACGQVADALPAMGMTPEQMEPFLQRLANIANTGDDAVRAALRGLIEPTNEVVAGGGPDAHRRFLRALDALAVSCRAAGSHALD